MRTAPKLVQKRVFGEMLSSPLGRRILRMSLCGKIIYFLKVGGFTLFESLSLRVVGFLRA